MEINEANFELYKKEICPCCKWYKNTSDESYLQCEIHINKNLNITKCLGYQKNNEGMERENEGKSN